jgi:hypothetical protein
MMYFKMNLHLGCASLAIYFFSEILETQKYMFYFSKKMRALVCMCQNTLRNFFYIYSLC